MIISHKHKCVCIKTRKDGGSSLEKCLFLDLGPNDVCTGETWGDNYPRLNYDDMKGNQKFYTHFRKDEFMDYLGMEGWEKIKLYYKFSIERQPWEKVVSMYFWLHKSQPLHMKKFIDFNHWIREEIPRKLTSSDFLHYNELSDKVYRYENLQPLFDDLKTHYNIDIQDQFNQTWCKKYSRPDWKLFYRHNSDNIKIIEEKFARTIEFMGYTFEEFYD